MKIGKVEISSCPYCEGTDIRYGYQSGDVGIYVGNNQMYHAGNPIGYTDLTSAYWQQHIICAGRIKQ